jgi:two-component system sensor histidine kinase QseC
MRALPSSLQGRLLAGVLGAVVLVWLATAAFTWSDVQHELDELLDGHLAQAAALLVVQQARAGDDDDRSLDAPQLHRYAPRVAFQVWHDGVLTMRSANAPAVPMVALDPNAVRRGQAESDDEDERDPKPGRETPPAAFGLGFHDARITGTAWRVFVAQGAKRDVQVFVGEQVASRHDILWAVLRGTLRPLAMALPLLALLIWWAVREGTAPLRALRKTLAARDAQALGPVTLPDVPAEMAPMLDALNQLFWRITTMVAAERRFTADAAHELRTPIAAIRTQAQVALAERNDAERAHALRATLAGCDRATRLVEQLLLLSRLEAGESTANGTASAPLAPPVDLAALAQQVAAELAPSAIERRQNLGLEAAPGARVAAHPTLLAVLLRNLIDNALRYSPDGAEVRLAVSVADGQVHLQVDDSGPGLAAADLRRLGERFFRVLGSGQEGSGLGWSIVRRIAAAQGAVIEVARSTALGGLAVVVRWPLAAADPTR